MAEPQDSCQLFNQFENSALVSLIGPNGVEVGTLTFNPAKFNLGMFTNNVLNHATFDYRLAQTAGAVEYWFVAEENSAGLGGSVGRSICSIDIGTVGGPNYHFFNIKYISPGGPGADYFETRWFEGATNLQLQHIKSFLIGDKIHIFAVWDRNGIDGGADIHRMYIDGVLVASSAVDAVPQWGVFLPLFYSGISSVGGAGLTQPTFNTLDNGKIYSRASIDDTWIALVIANMNNEKWPLPAIVPATYTKKQPKVLVLNSGIDLVELGYVTNIGKTTEQKTFRRDKITTNQVIIPVHNIDDQFNPDNPTSLFANTNWRYTPVKKYDEDDNLTWDGILDDFIDNQKGKRTGLLTRDNLLKLYNTKIDYVSDDWETPGDAFKNICDAYNAAYNTKYVTDSIAQYKANNCYIKCYFNLVDGVNFQQAIEKVAKVGAADCYSANNELNYKLWIPFVGGVKFHLTDSDLSVAVKSKLSRVYYNNYIIGYVGDFGIPTQDAANNFIGKVSVKNNGPQDIRIDGSNEQQIEIKDLVSAIFLGEQHIKRTHVNLSTIPFPPLIINFSLPYSHKDFINLQTWFRLTNVAKGWDDKLFEVYINDKDYTKRLINIKAYEVNESG